MSGAGEAVAARIGSLGVYATPVELAVTHRSRSERAVRALFTLAGCWLVAPLAFMIPPYLESGLIALLVGVYFARRAWVGEWIVERMAGTCPRCGAAITMRSGSVLYLPHTLRCTDCSTECWMELEPAPSVDDALRREAIERAVRPSSGSLGGAPPITWSPASSDWRDLPRG